MYDILEMGSYLESSKQTVVVWIGVYFIQIYHNNLDNILQYIPIICTLL